MKRAWKSEAGSVLQECEAFGQKMTDYVPGESAIYAWKRKFPSPSEIDIEGNPVALAEWIASAVKTPSAILSERELSHYLLLHGISIGGAPLTADKLETLRDWVKDVQCRKWLIGMVQSIAELTPPLYVGETDNLARRVKDHLRFSTDFSKTLRDSLHLDWKNTELWYLPVPEAFLKIDAKARRTLVELVVARLTIAGSTSRPG